LQLHVGSAKEEEGQQLKSAASINWMAKATPVGIPLPPLGRAKSSANCASNADMDFISRDLYQKMPEWGTIQGCRHVESHTQTTIPQVLFDHETIVSKDECDTTGVDNPPSYNKYSCTHRFEGMARFTAFSCTKNTK
jgi:hypothetical protein